MKKSHIFARMAVYVSMCAGITVGIWYGLSNDDIFNAVETAEAIEVSSDITPFEQLRKDNYQNFLDLVAEKRAENEARIKAEQEEASRLAAEAEATMQYYEPAYSGGGYSVGSDFFRDGVWNDGNYRYTWYSSQDRHHYQTSQWIAGSDNIYRDSDGYVVVASSDHPKGTVITGTPFGDVKVYDTGCASGTLDVYTNY